MSKKTKKALLIAGVTIVVLGLAYWYWYLYNNDTASEIYTDENGITYYPDGSYTYVQDGDVVTVNADGSVTIKGYEPGMVTNTNELAFNDNLPGRGE